MPLRKILSSRWRQQTWAFCAGLLLAACSARGQFLYFTDNGAITISKYTGSSVDVTIPASLDGLPVTRILDSAFASLVETVRVPASVTNIGRGAFGNCVQLRAINVDAANPSYTTVNGVLFDKLKTELIVYPNGTPDGVYQVSEGVTTIAASAFRKAFVTNIVIPASVTNIGEFAFSASSLATLTIPASVSSIGLSAFADCLSLKQASISGNLQSLPPNIFDSCFKLESVSIPPSVNSIGPRAFYSCNSLQDVALPAGLTNLEAEAFGYCASLTNIVLPIGIRQIAPSLFHDCSQLQSVSMPVGLTNIGQLAFFNCRELRDIDIPGSVTSIGQSAFSQCGLGAVRLPVALTNLAPQVFAGATNLASVTLPSNLASIGDEAFDSCSSLSSIVLPEQLESIGERAFVNCSALQTILIPPKVTLIGSGAFAACAILTNVELPAGLVTIGDHAFWSCQRLPTIQIPRDVSTIGDLAFSGCASLASINVDIENPTFSSVEGVLFSKDHTLLICYPPSRNAVSYNVPFGVTGIASEAFMGCKSLERVSAPSSTAIIGSRTFENCPALKAVYFAGEPTSEDPSVFIDTTNVKIYYLPGTQNWGALYCGAPTAVWNPVLTRVAVGNNVFELTVTGDTGLEFVVEACSDLANPVWLPLGDFSILDNEVLVSGDSDPKGDRFFRIRSP